ncbi:iron complex transport system ATP-binding protein [Knoellia remsis]|uniref:Iron complex transport system ATP-binding protein n=1 Tax=Knoellia remsis TaxID=407159 RepID=A0A2T0ULJ3_9MICO|nr:ABC transporter ATP-binding protein [Knoellia remsis]PRY58756.1 iron complex transport system ATP-binding protein [Knoellia remsis]
MTAFHIDSLTVRFGERAALDDVTLTLPRHTVTAIVGPNGCGKSTLLRSLARLLRPTQGRVLLGDEDVSGIDRRDFARRVALLPQGPQAPDNLSVIDLVARGRDPYRRWFDQWSRPDEDIVTDALRRTGLEDVADRPLETLSGGQRQRAWVALALAQRTDILLLDEPTTYLDLAHQLDVLDTVTELHRRDGVTVVMVLHDLSLAARYADHVVAMRSGGVVEAGPVAEVITPAMLRAVFDVEAQIVPDPDTGRPLIVPRGGAHTWRTVTQPVPVG